MRGARAGGGGSEVYKGRGPKSDMGMSVKRWWRWREKPTLGQACTHLHARSLTPACMRAPPPPFLLSSFPSPPLLLFRYAFIELRTPEMATAALQLSNQVTLHGRAMTVERPQDYADPAKQAQAATVSLPPSGNLVNLIETNPLFESSGWSGETE